MNRKFPKSNVQFITGDCNECIEEVIGAIPAYSKDQSVLSFCFVDPFSLSIKFSTIQKLATNFVDFLFLLALHMDANRAFFAYYTKQKNRKLDEFLGLPDWRDRWKAAEAKGDKPPRFLAQEYSKQMETLNYLPMPFHKMKLVRAVKNVPLYHLALFSRHRLALTFWKEVLQYGNPQQKLFGS